MEENRNRARERAWYICKVLLWYFFYQLACTFGFSLLDDAARLLTGSEIYFTTNATLAASLFVSALLTVWHLLKFGYMKFSPRFFSEVPASALVKSTLLIFGSMYLFNVVMTWIPLPDLMENTFMELSDEPLGVLSMALIAPVLEEMIFRGTIQGYLMRRCRSPWTGILVSAVIFGAIHMNPQQVVYATLLGIVFGWIYYRTRSLMPVILGHVLNNSVAVVSMKIWGTEDIEAITSDSTMTMLPLLIIIAAGIVSLAMKLNSELPAVPQPWREISEDGTESDKANED